MNFEAAAEAFRSHFDQGLEVGASLVIIREGDEVLNLAAGKVSKADDAAPWTDQTLVPVYSASKGPAAATFVMVLQSAGISLESEVRHVWPALSAASSGLAFAEVLAHEAGLSALDAPVAVTDQLAVVNALEHQTPLWNRGDGHGYHARTFGFLLEEIIRRVTNGSSLGEMWRTQFGKGLDFYFGLPESLDHRVARLYPGRIDQHSPEKEFFATLGNAESLTRRSFLSPRGLHAISDMNQPENWRPGYAAFGGIGTASALAKFYAQFPLDYPALAASMVQGRSRSFDKVLLRETEFSTGCMTNIPGLPEGCFGHPGAGGSLAFADPANRLGFAYTMNQMELCVVTGTKVQNILRALYQ